MTHGPLAGLVALVLLASFQGGSQQVEVPPVPDRVFVLVMNGMTFNGFTFPSSPLLEAETGEVLQFVVAVPLTAEAHVFHLHGHPWYDEEQGRFIDAKLINPGEQHVFNVTAGAPGDWMYHCHFDQHFAAGMWGIMRVHPVGGLPPGANEAVELPVDLPKVPHHLHG